jgi:very-short-patch-repair endonuclease
MSKKKFNHKAWQERVKLSLADAKMSCNKEYADKQREEIRAELRGVFGKSDSGKQASSYQSQNRKKMTYAEYKFYEILSEIGEQVHSLEYEFQSVFYPNPKDHTKFFILDFYITNPRAVVIEIDGGYHNAPVQSRKDAWRQQLIEDHGIKVLRYDNDFVLGNKDRVKNDIMRAISRH